MINQNVIQNIFGNVKKNRILQILIRYISIVSVLSLSTLFTPNFTITSLPILFLSGVIVISLDYMMAVITGIHDYPFARGIVGFVSAAIIIYMTQFFVDGYYISIISSLIAAAIYGIVDFLLPNNSD